MKLVSFDAGIPMAVRTLKAPFKLFIAQYVGEKSSAYAAVSRLDGNPDNWMEMDIIKQGFDDAMYLDHSNHPINDIKGEKTFKYLYKAMCSLINIRGIIDEGLDVEGNEDIIL